MTTRKNVSDRLPFTDEELGRLTPYEFAKLKLTDDEKSRLRAINERRWLEIDRKAAELRQAEQPLVEDLRAAGFDVESASDLFNRKQVWNKKERVRPYLEALPILLRHLGRAYPPAVREGIARALAVPQSRFAWHDLVRFYRHEEADSAKDGLAVAIAAAADQSVLNELIALAKDREQGSSRLLLLSALARSSDPKARAALMELGADPDLALEVQIIFRRQRSKLAKGAKPKS
ncbi:hypothetical protein [Rhodanobacter sp. DHG33]|uniref:hypothetical protein n=1 Tax=Rhodanobacter sp. DHG33 TaxID=2775921 RepID=UPI001784E4E0|nr:hypothetical protein [Rhodanobacter sp. DHG33]MBD8898324.1 hypothetical protein [Rhodanobacter sp. DHG33]